MMKKLLSFCLLFASVLSCNEDKHGRQIIGYKEYIVTVASTKLPGIPFSYGSDFITDVYAVKIENSNEWELLPGINGFDYEEGNEYRLRISETDYLDYSMGDPAWTEYDLLEILSKERKDSENLPPYFIPEWYFEKEHCGKVNPDFSYAIQADNKEEIEKDIQADASYKFDGLDLYVDHRSNYWFTIDSEMKTRKHGALIMNNINPEELPETYKLLAPAYQIRGCQQFDFMTYDLESTVLQYVAFFYDKPAGKSEAPQNIGILLYKDLTTHYQAKYPEAGITAVVLRYDVDITVHYI